MFFFNDTATTEIYTYGHTLSLHTLFRSLDSVGVKVTIVDINPSSFELARRYFGLPDQVHCHVADGKKFLDSNEHRYDAIVLDAFLGDRIPRQFCTDGFLRLVKARLDAEFGRFVVNVHEIGRESCRERVCQYV